jgi:alkanesulfonate monooxygenase SsuD/methylene tetrahydromethanopterin reductase-like flavin-dependent oxidoreductase (luciferase family)
MTGVSASAATKQTTSPVAAADPRTVRHPFGLFLPSGGGAFSLSTYPRATIGTWDDLRDVAVYADTHGFDFLVPPMRWVSLGGELDWQGQRFETFTLTSALATVTQRALLVPTCHTPIYHPVLAAKMIADLDRYSHGRAGINVVSGRMGSDFRPFGQEMRDPAARLAYNEEWMMLFLAALREPEFAFSGQHFTAERGQLEPKPSRMPVILKAGVSPESRELVARTADWLFIGGWGGSEQTREIVSDLHRRAAEHGRAVKVMMFVFVLVRDTPEAARAMHACIAAHPARQSIRAHMSLSPDAEIDPQIEAGMAVAIGTHEVIGDPEGVAAGIREVLDAGIDGILFTFFDYVRDLTRFTQDVLPLLPRE